MMRQFGSHETFAAKHVFKCKLEGKFNQTSKFVIVQFVENVQE